MALPKGADRPVHKKHESRYVSLPSSLLESPPPPLQPLPGASVLSRDSYSDLFYTRHIDTLKETALKGGFITKNKSNIYISICGGLGDCIHFFPRPGSSFINADIPIC